MLIVTADDYGLDPWTTDSILRAGAAQRISSASAMVFMADSERAAQLAATSTLEFGLHVNLTDLFNAPGVPAHVRAHQERIRRFLKGHRLAPIRFNPRLGQSYRVVVESQVEEFKRLYGYVPPFFNGHHHMHLCLNVLSQRLIPPASRVRTTFTFEPGEKSMFNRLYRSALRRWVARYYLSTAAFFSIEPVGDLERLERIINRSRRESVEVETHPANPDEMTFLLGPSYGALLKGAALHRFSDLPA